MAKSTLQVPVSNSSTAQLRSELKAARPMYQTIDDCLGGSFVVKARGPLYLPKPNPMDTTPQNLARYKAYLARAVFYNVTRRTLQGFVGEMFDTDPVIIVPPAMQNIVEDATGDGVGLTQTAKIVTGLVLGHGRSGLFVDYPNTGGKGTTKDDIETKGVRPVIKYYHPLKIINWMHKKVGAMTKLSLVVVEEEYDRPSTVFEVKKGKQWRVMRLDDNNVYTVELYRDVTGTATVDEEGNLSAVMIPTKSDGTVFNTIPFFFIGSESNDANVDYPPLFDLADLNIAHYRNSADYEEAVYIVGQPTIVISGLTQDWVDKYFADGVPLGARASISLPAGANAELLEVTATAMAHDAMEQKERQMVALGAKLVEQTSVQRTASEASIEVASEMSVLSNVAGNVSVAFENALAVCAEYIGVPDTEIQFLLNKEFSISFADPLSRTEVVAAWVSGAISWTEMRAAMRKGGVASQDDEVARNEMKDDLANGDGPTVPGAGGFDAQGNPIDNAGTNPDGTKKTPATKTPPTKKPAAKATGE